MLLLLFQYRLIYIYIDIQALYKTHLKHGRLLTLTAVHQVGRFGELELDGNRIQRFNEKPPNEGYVNGGFMVLKRDFIRSYLAGQPDMFFEDAPMKNATADHQVEAYRHEGFWQCMDTPREHALLNSMWQAGKAPWTEAW